MPLINTGSAYCQTVSLNPLPPAENAPAVLSQEQESHFSDAMQALAKQGHVAIVAEGWPLHDQLPADKAPAIPTGTAISTAITTIAAAYDYDASYRDGAWRLTKRYSDPSDLPEVTQAECSEAMADVVMVMKPYAVDATWPPKQGALSTLIPELAATLTPDEIQELQKNDLPVSDLDSNQEALAWKFALYFYDQTSLNSAQTTLGTLQEAVNSSVGEGTVANKYRLFGYQVEDLSGKLKFLPFASTLTVSADGSYTDPSAPSLPTVSSQDAAPPEPKPGLTTLEAETESLSKQGSKIVVDRALMPKPVFVADGGNATPDQILEAVAAVYGLRIYRHDDGTLQLMRPLYAMPANIASLGDAIWHVLPAPLLRAIHEGEPVKPVDQAVLANPKTPAADIAKAMQGNRALPGEIHAAALVKLHQDIAAYQKDHKNTDLVPLSALSEPDREAFAVVLMTDFLQSALSEYDHPVPFYLTNFGQLVLRGGPYKSPDNRSQWKFALNFALPDGKGGTQQGPGMFDMPYFPPTAQ